MADGGADGPAAAGDATGDGLEGDGVSEYERETLAALRTVVAEVSPRRAALVSEVRRHLGDDPRPALESLRDRGIVQHLEAADLWRPEGGEQ